MDGASLGICWLTFGCRLFSVVIYERGCGKMSEMAMGPEEKCFYKENPSIRVIIHKRCLIIH